MCFLFKFKYQKAHFYSSENLYKKNPFGKSFTEKAFFCNYSEGQILLNRFCINILKGFVKLKKKKIFSSEKQPHKEILPDR